MDHKEPKPTEADAGDMISNYLGYIAHLDMPLAAKIEMIGALQQIMRSFVDRAFGDDPVQHVHGIYAEGESDAPPVLELKAIQTPDPSLSSAFRSPAAGRRKKERP